MERVLVDGYNVIHAWVPLKRLLDVSLEAARDKLVERLAVYAMVTGSDVTVVFDAHHSAARSNNIPTALPSRTHRIPGADPARSIRSPR